MLSVKRKALIKRFTLCVFVMAKKPYPFFLN